MIGNGFIGNYAPHSCPHNRYYEHQMHFKHIHICKQFTREHCTQLCKSSKNHITILFLIHLNGSIFWNNITNYIFRNKINWLNQITFFLIAKAYSQHQLSTKNFNRQQTKQSPTFLKLLKKLCSISIYKEMFQNTSHQFI